MANKRNRESTVNMINMPFLAYAFTATRGPRKTREMPQGSCGACRAGGVNETSGHPQRQRPIGSRGWETADQRDRRVGVREGVSTGGSSRVALRGAREPTYDLPLRWHEKRWHSGYRSRFCGHSHPPARPQARSLMESNQRGQRVRGEISADRTGKSRTGPPATFPAPLPNMPLPHKHHTRRPQASRAPPREAPGPCG